MTPSRRLGFNIPLDPVFPLVKDLEVATDRSPSRSYGFTVSFLILGGYSYILKLAKQQREGPKYSVCSQSSNLTTRLAHLTSSI